MSCSARCQRSTNLGNDGILGIDLRRINAKCRTCPEFLEDRARRSTERTGASSKEKAVEQTGVGTEVSDLSRVEAVGHVCIPGFILRRCEHEVAAGA